MAGQRLTIVFMPESAYGPTNNCIGIGKVLERRGHRVVFAAEASRGKLEPLGFEEDLVDLSPPAEGDQDAGQFWIDFVAETAPEFRKPTIEQLATFIEPVVIPDRRGGVLPRTAPGDPGSGAARRHHRGQRQQLPGTAHPRRALGEDHVVQPARTEGLRAPPTFGGPHRRPDGMGRVRRRGRTHPPRHVGAVQRLHGGQRGAAALDLEFIHESERLNLYVYPEAADYRRSHAPAPTWHRLESSVRRTEEAWDVPEELAGEGALVYLSPGRSAPRMSS